MFLWVECLALAHALRFVVVKIKIMTDWLYKISSYGLFLPILIAIYHYKFLNKSLWCYFFGLLASNIFSIISIQLGEHGINNHFMIYASACSTMIFRTLFFYFFLDSKENRLAENGYGYDPDIDKFISHLDKVKAEYQKRN